MKRSSPNTGASAKAWLLMAREGGHWNSMEVARKLGLSRREVAPILSSLVRHGRAKDFQPDPKDEKRRKRYGVTPACSFPQGVTLASVIACGLHKFEAAA